MKKTLTWMDESHEPIKTDMIRFIWPRKEKHRKVYINKPHKPIDDRYVLYTLLTILFLVVLAMTMILSRQIGWVQGNLENHILAETTVKAQLPEFESAIVEHTPTPIPEPTVTPATESLPLPSGSDGSFKAFERERLINDDTSEQYKLKQLYWKDEQGFCRFYDLYVVAMGQFYAQRIGQIFRIQFEYRTILAIVGDVKDDKDTIDGMYCRENGSIVEFIIDDAAMDPTIYKGGDASALGMTGKVVKILEVG